MGVINMERYAILKQQLKTLLYEQDPSLLLDVYEVIDKASHYEDIAEQGRLVELPVPIGTKIYVRCMSCPPTYKPEYCTDWKDDVEQGCENCPHRILSAIEDEFDYSYIHLFGENVFLTREEAEATSTTTRSWEVSGDA